MEILASYRKREVLMDILKTLNSIMQLKSTDTELQKLLGENNYAGAITLLLECRSSAEEYNEYLCVQSLNNKLQETLILTEFQLDTVLNEMVLNFDVKKYENLQGAYKILNKSLIAMDQLHINFISAIHSSVNGVLRSYSDPNETEDVQKLLYDQWCATIPTDRYIPCLIALCKTFWTILASYYQIVIWHQNFKLFDDTEDSYIQEKLKKGQSRIWNDMLAKLCTYLSCSQVKSLKYDQFIQILWIVQRLKKIGQEFCGETSTKLIDTMQSQSVEFFNRYHIACLEEICLFLDNETWTAIDSFTNILQLQEFRSVRNSLLRRQKSPPAIKTEEDELVSVHSQDAGSSLYGSCGYFMRFSEKSSPFDGGLDAAMLEEDILSGIVDEGSCYFSEESDDENKSFLNISEDDCSTELSSNEIMANNTSVNVLRCIGRYMEMCKLLHSISPKIINSMLELIDFYGYTVHEIFCKDSSVSLDNLYTEKSQRKILYMEHEIAPKIKIWPLNYSSLRNNELANPETLFGLSQRVIAIESYTFMMKQFRFLNGYLKHLLPQNQHELLLNYQTHIDYINEISKPIYTCVTSRLIDLPGILSAMSKVKWDINHVSVEHSKYVDTLNRSIQMFAMRLEEVVKSVTVPLESLWDSMAHVATHLLVEGYSNVKKCSAGGRALMQLDFTHFISIMELLSGLKFSKHRSYVDNYIKAYYFPIDLFEEWILKQSTEPNYSTKQLSNLISCVLSGDKRTKQKMLALLDCNSNNSTNLNETQ
ncbi:CCDC132 family protein [Megaselia abdita]